MYKLRSTRWAVLLQGPGVLRINGLIVVVLVIGVMIVQKPLCPLSQSVQNHVIVTKPVKQSANHGPIITTLTASFGQWIL